jgi:hypothetical protein
MTLETQFQIKSNPYYLRYLREHSEWYKYLNRNPNLINEMIEKAKEYYGLRPTDKIGKALDTLELVQNILTTIK